MGDEMKLHRSLTVSRIEAAARSQMFDLEDPGFCVSCGTEYGQCEPDAREYPCDLCGTRTVYGAMELLLEVCP